jgi:translation elongation factor EF-Tu-like GTPase
MGAEKLTTILELRCSVRFLTEEAGDNVGILRGIETLKRNGYVSQVQLSHTSFKAEVYILKEEGGRHTV